MKTRLDYRSGSYGTGSDVQKYRVIVSNSRDGRIFIRLIPDEPARGRGVGPGKGAVQQQEIALPAKVAKRLAEAIGFVASEGSGTAQAEIDIDEGSVPGQ